MGTESHYSYPQLPLHAATKKDDKELYHDVLDVKPALPPRSTKTMTPKQDDYAYCTADFVTANRKSSCNTVGGEDLNSIADDRVYSVLEPEYYACTDTRITCFDMECPETDISVVSRSAVRICRLCMCLLIAQCLTTRSAHHGCGV